MLTLHIEPSSYSETLGGNSVPSEVCSPILFHGARSPDPSKGFDASLKGTSVATRRLSLSDPEPVLCVVCFMAVSFCLFRLFAC